MTTIYLDPQFLFNFRSRESRRISTVADKCNDFALSFLIANASKGAFTLPDNDKTRIIINRICSEKFGNINTGPFLYFKQLFSCFFVLVSLMRFIKECNSGSQLKRDSLNFSCAQVYVTV